jgi:hypothetical protein
MMTPKLGDQITLHLRDTVREADVCKQERRLTEMSLGGSE